MKYRVGGKVSHKAVEDAVRLSKEKYCSVSAMLEKSAKITSEIEYDARDGSHMQRYDSNLFFTQPGCFSCELMSVYLEAREIAFEERDISADLEDRRVMTEQYGSHETPRWSLIIDATSRYRI